MMYSMGSQYSSIKIKRKNSNIKSNSSNDNNNNNNCIHRRISKLPILFKSWHHFNYLVDVYASKLILEVFGGAGAIWGFSEVVGIRNSDTHEFWRAVALTFGFAFFIRLVVQICNDEVIIRMMEMEMGMELDETLLLYEEEEEEETLQQPSPFKTSLTWSTSSTTSSNSNNNDNDNSDDDSEGARGINMITYH